jgi:hypothetical protein
MSTSKVLPLLSAAIVLLSGAGSPETPTMGTVAPRAKDQVKLSFVVVGCNRIQSSDWKKFEKMSPDPDPSSANLNQLKQTFADIAGLKPVPNHFFFTGDLVLNLADDNGQTLKGQLDAWAELYKSDPSGIAGKLTLVPLTGNHEMLKELKITDPTTNVQYSIEVPNKPTDKVWTAWLKANGFDKYAGNGPSNKDRGNPDMLVDDQRKLTYSFDLGDTHFIVINTDTANTQNNTGWVAYNWVARDLQKAQRNKKVRAIFALGHKPLVVPIASADDFGTILSPLNFWLQELFEQTPKFKAYICAHAHQWDVDQLGGPGGTWQVVAGNGGSELASGWQPHGGPYFGFTVVNLYQSGRVGIVSYRRPVPSSGYLGPTVPAKPGREVFLTK